MVKLVGKPSWLNGSERLASDEKVGGSIPSEGTGSCKIKNMWWL